MPITWPVAVAVAVVIVGLAVPVLYLLLRRLNRDKAFVSYPTMFGTARIFTLRRDPDQDFLEQDGTPHASAGAHNNNGEDAEAATAPDGAPDDGAPDDPVNWVRVMEIDGAYQTATFVDDERCYDLVFDYYKMYNHVFELDIPVKHLFMIGGGGYAYPKYVISRHPGVAMDVVEIDPAVTQLAERYFFLDRLIEEFDTERTGRLGLVCDDGRAYLETCTQTYDAVLNDTFAGRSPVLALATVEAFTLVKAHLTPNGAYLANVVAALSGPKARFLHQVANTLLQVFAHVYVATATPDALAEPAAEENHIVIATDSACAFAHVTELAPYPGIAPLYDADVEDDARASSMAASAGAI